MKLTFDLFFVSGREITKFLVLQIEHLWPQKMKFNTQIVVKKYQQPVLTKEKIFSRYSLYHLISTLRRYFQDFQVVEGYLWSVDQLIRIKANDLTELQRIITIQFDEIYLKSDINYDSKEDQIVGPHSKVNVAQIRGVFDNYKIPVWYV